MKTSKKVTLIVSLIMATIVLWASVLVPLPYYIESPGGASDVRQVLKVDGKEDKEPGSYNFTYVRVLKGTALQLLMAYFNKHADIYTEQEMTGGSSNADYFRISQFYMETSQNIAKYQALNLAGKEVNMDFFGVYVLNVADDSTFKGILNIADTVTSINGKTFKSSAELIKYISGLKLGSDVTVGYESNDKSHTADGKIIKLENGKNGIGIGLVDHTEVNSKVPIEFYTDNIGGPSAGLMFTLAIYTQLADPDLRDGRMIAGTGTIEQDGSVGDIGGIDKKVLSAAQAGATVFFAPNNPVDKEILKVKPDALSNYDEAVQTVKEEGLDIEVVPVKNVKEAIAYLEKTKGE
ncbi:SepM family pheromone-processing serine protease [Streptococcus ovis]|uniref:SepM family pheromone-processing serine protease n=1 Tax=Streptococcus ovis TaxID=82806 RepID=UPI000372CA29|nr:SepM family pheromone-processing serine protease [Streptococcus ovis]